MTVPPPRETGVNQGAVRRELEAELEALADLDRRRGDSLIRIEGLRSQLPSRSSPAEESSADTSPVAGTSTGPASAAEKVALFRSLFRGRQDIFPTRFVSRKTGKAGYAPACTNKFVPGVCELPRVKCGECQNQAFVPVTDTSILDHLQGRHVIGLYPMLPDETCWLLAADFDAAAWRDDVAAFVQTCRAFAVPVAVERSRSGNGAHAWLFFESATSAATARTVGSFLITETMSRRHQMKMASYDRLFPSQDTMPRGGFGNLIALPLQLEARQQGNTVFLDDGLEPVPDQWAYLNAVVRMSRTQVDALATDATVRGLIVGVRDAGSDDDDFTPWARRQTSGPARVHIDGPLPTEVHAVLCQRLFVDTTGLPPPLITAIKRAAAFQNPEFYKKQSMRLSTAGTPRVISCAEDLPRHVSLPRACRAGLDDLLLEHGVRLVVDDQRCVGVPFEAEFHGQLSDIQRQAAEALLAHENGVLVAPPGMGKTVLGAYLVARRRVNTLVLVHRRPLLDQWIAQLSLFLGIEVREIGQIASGKRTANGYLDVAMLQSLVRKEAVDAAVSQYGHVIVDECHHLPAFSFERVLSEVKARFVTGLTATPRRRDGHDPITEMQLGPARFVVKPRSDAARRSFKHRLIVQDTDFRVPPGAGTLSIQEIYALLAHDEARNRQILDDIIQAVDEKRSPLVLTERKDHLEYFAEHLRKTVKHVVVLQGGLTGKQRREALAQLASIPPDRERLVLATGRYIGEGFDDARLDTLFLAMPISWKGTLVQYTGRLHRLHPGKTEVRIHDFVDVHVPMLRRMFDRRLRGYRAIGYTRVEGSLTRPPSFPELRVELDRAAGESNSGE